MNKLVRIRTAKPLHNHIVQIEFTDGTVKDIDLAPFLRGPIFDDIRNRIQVFQSLKVDPRMGTIVWENGADIDPDVLYYGLEPAWMEPKTVQP